MDVDTLARLEGHECFSPRIPFEADCTHLDGPRKVPVSKFSPYDSDSPPRRTGVFRSLSTRIKGAIRRHSTIAKMTVSRPTHFHDFDPRYANHDVVHPDVKAVPIEQAQQRLRKYPKPTQPEISAPYDFKRGSGDAGYTTYPETWTKPPENPVPELRHRRGQVVRLNDRSNKYPHALAAKPSKLKKGSQRKQVSPLTETEKPRRRKFVGDPDRDTVFGDFVHAQDLSSDEDVRVQKAPDDDDFSILDIEPLRPHRKPLASKKVDTSRYSWVPGKTPVLPKPTEVTSQHDWRMSQEYPTVDDLFDEIDHQIADANIPEQEKPAMNREAHRPNRMVDEEDAEPEVIIDTFTHDSHSSWVATQRPDASTARSNYRRFQQEAYDNARDQDEARILMERVRRLRHCHDVRVRD